MGSMACTIVLVVDIARQHPRPSGNSIGSSNLRDQRWKAIRRAKGAWQFTAETAG